MKEEKNSRLNHKTSHCRGGRAERNSKDGIEITYLFSFMDLVESLSLLKSCMMQHLDFLWLIHNSNFMKGSPLEA